jgi:hypothetical protein
MCLPFILETLCAFAGPAPYAEPNIEGETDDPEGIPDTQRLIASVPLVLTRNSGALTVRRDGQERDDRDDLSSEMGQHVASRRASERDDIHMRLT